MTYYVVAKLEGQRFRVETHETYPAALARWYDLDGALRAGRLAIVGPALTRNIPSVRVVEHVHGAYFAVREITDPEWRDAPRISLTTLRRGKGTTDVGAVIRAVGIDRGLHGHAGGWLYRGGTEGHAPDTQGCHRVSYQGWHSWWYGSGDAESIVKVGSRYHRTAEPFTYGSIPCDDCHRSDGTHDLSVEH